MPKGKESADISALDEFKQNCKTALPTACSGDPLNCWSGGDTGGFFDYQDEVDAKGE